MTQPRAKEIARSWIFVAGIGLVLALSLLAGTAVLAYRNGQRLLATTEALAHAREVRAGVLRVLSALQGAETGQRGYVISGDRRYLEPYWRARVELPSALARIATLTAGDPAQQAEMPRLRRLVRRKMHALRRTVLVRRHRGFDAAAAMVASGQGKRAMDAFRGVVDRMERRETELLAARARLADEIARDERRVVAAAILLSAIVLALFLVTARRYLRHRARAAAADARLRGIVTSASDAIISVDAAQRITLFNTAAEAMFGHSAHEMIGATLDRLIPAPLRDRHRAHVDAFGATGTRARAMGGDRVLAGVRRNGEEFPVEARISRVEVAGQTLYTVVLRDVTERRRAEALAAADMRAVQAQQRIGERFIREHDLHAGLRDVLDAAMEATAADFGNVQLLDPGTGTLDIVVQRGFEREFLEFFSGHERGACSAALRLGARVIVDDVAADPIFAEARTQAVMRNAGVRAVQSTPLTSLSGELLGVLSTHFRTPRRLDDRILRFVDVLARQAGDIIEYVRAEERRAELLRVAEAARSEAEQAAQLIARVQQIVEAMLGDRPLDELLHELLTRVRETLDVDVAVILACGLEGEGELRVRAVAGAADAASGLTVRFGDGICGRIARERRELVANDVQPPEIALPFLRVLGVSAIAGVPLLSGERLLGVLQVASVRGRRFTDDDVHLLNVAGQRIALGIERASRHDAERREHEALEAANRMKDEFLAMLGHELRNPLAAVRTAVVTAQLDPARRDRALAILRRQVDHLARLVDDLLDVARISEGKITLRRDDVFLATVVERAVDTAQPLLDERRHGLSVSLCDEILHVSGDPARLEQVLVNVLSNAAKYTEPGGTIAVGLAREGNVAVVRVRDSGIGIAPDMLPRVFDLFAQSARTLDRAQGGLGIGLTLVRRLVELHGGSVEARSDGPGKGSEFVIRLPVQPVRGDVAPSTPLVPFAKGRARVLIVEDNDDAADALQMLLEVLGHEVYVVRDGPSALAAVRARPPDVALVDIGLPGMDGYEVARKVRALPRGHGVILVALTGYGRDEDKDLASAAGFDYHLTKPVDVDALQRLVARLGRHRFDGTSTVH